MMRGPSFNDEHELFRVSVRNFLAREVVPYAAEWARSGIVDRALFTKAGAAGFLGISVPEAYGGGGVQDFRYSQIMIEESQLAGVGGVMAGPSTHTDVCLPYVLHGANENQRSRWLPGICSGELITAVAMTEPGAGSDLAAIRTTAERDGDSYIVNGSKTFITNGINSDLIITAVKTDPTRKHDGITLVVIEREMDGFERGRNLDKIGLHAQDTAELFFHDVRVPVANRLGEEGSGFQHLMRNLVQERLAIGVLGVAAAAAALRWTLAYCKEREAFGQPIAEFQNTRFRLAEIATEVQVAQTFIDACVAAHNQGALSAHDAAMAKLWCTDAQGRVLDAGLQLFGGYGYMAEYPIAQAYTDARVTRIYGGTNEIMKELIGRTLVRQGLTPDGAEPPIGGR